MRLLFLCSVLMLTCASCVHRGGVGNHFGVIPGTPEYLLESPDGHRAPFSEVLQGYNGYKPGLDWIDIKPGMELHIEDAFYKEGMPRSGLAGFLGTETAQYILRTYGGGLRLRFVKSMPNRPAHDTPVEDLISPAQKHHHVFRFYNQVFFRGNTQHARGSVLLGGTTKGQLARLIAGMEHNPDAVCSENKDACTIFPEACSVAVEMNITVNSHRSIVPWTSTLRSVSEEGHQPALSRLYHGHLMPVTLPANDADALRLSLLPGDHITWK